MKSAMASDISANSHLQQMGSAEIISEDRTWLGQRPRRTKAMPKNTLFGGTLEIYKDEDKQKITSIDIEQFQKDIEKQRRIRQTRYHTKLPAYLRKTSEEDINYEKSKESVSKQLKEHEQAKKILDILETNSKFFNVGVHGSRRPSPGQEKLHQWFQKDALKHSEKINITGIDGSNPINYNRDKYARKPETHQYALIGDPLRPGMDFSDENMPIGVNINNNNGDVKVPYVKAQDPSWLPKEAYMKKSVKDPLMADISIDIPPNIQHSFGTQICAKVLADKTKVMETMERQEQQLKNYNKTRSITRGYVLPESTTDPVYEDISHIGRQNVIPGYPFNHTINQQKVDYSEFQFKERLKDRNDFRVKRDDLSTWTEHNVLRHRTMKQWEIYNNEKPKFDANWDRTAKRPEPPAKPAPDKPKRMNKTKKPAGNGKGKADGGFEPVVFVTPPVTPPAVAPPPVMPKQEVKKDDEFWEFYNKDK